MKCKTPKTSFSFLRMRLKRTPKRPRLLGLKKWTTENSREAETSERKFHWDSKLIYISGVLSSQCLVRCLCYHDSWNQKLQRRKSRRSKKCCKMTTHLQKMAVIEARRCPAKLYSAIIILTSQISKSSTLYRFSHSTICKRARILPRGFRGPCAISRLPDEEEPEYQRGAALQRTLHQPRMS